MIAYLPIKIVSVANLREHWAVRAKRSKEHRTAAYFCCLAAESEPPSLPAVVTITRLSPSAKKLDTDNLASGCKATRDGVAEYLGIDDGDERITWKYDQRKADYWGCTVMIEAA